MDLIIQLERVPPQKYRVLFAGRAVGVWKDPECSAARWLIDSRLAARTDILRVYRGSELCLTGGVGWLADRHVNEASTPRFAKWTPHPMVAERRRLASADEDASSPTDEP